MPRTLVNTVTFTSNHGSLRLVRRPAQQMMNPSLGTMTTTAPEVVYEFVSGTLEVPPSKDVLPDKLVDGEWVEQDAIEYLRTHPENGIRFIEIKELIPDPGPIYAALTDALIAKDTAKIQALGDEEFSTYNRPDVMARIRDAADALDPDNTIITPSTE